MRAVLFTRAATTSYESWAAENGLLHISGGWKSENAGSAGWVPSEDKEKDCSRLFSEILVVC